MPPILGDLVKLPVDDELKAICREILKARKTSADWADVESSDMFQSRRYCGGFDANENAFCFSYHDADGTEFWFQVTIQDIREIVDGRLRELAVRPAE